MKFVAEVLVFPLKTVEPKTFIAKGAKSAKFIKVFFALLAGFAV